MSTLLAPSTLNIISLYNQYQNVEVEKRFFMQDRNMYIVY